MNLGSRIRFLLLILGICCIVTAISLKHAITKKDLLDHEATKLQKSLNINERIVDDFLSDTVQLQQVKRFHLEEDLALNFIENYRSKGINILIYHDNKLRFWSTFKAFPEGPASIHEGSSFAQFSNGWYEVIKKSFGSDVIIFLIDVRNQYKIENDYLINQFSPSLSKDNALTLASFSDKEVKGIYNIHGKLMFEVKLKSNFSESIYSSVEVWLWVIGIFSICLFFNSLCARMAKGGHLVSSTILLAIFFVALRLSDLQFGWFNHQFELAIFKPTIYGESFLLPSLGDFLLNVIAITWVLLFVYTHKDKYTLPEWMRSSRAAGFILHFVLLLIFTGLAFAFDKVFFGLIINSKINFDITNIINLDWLSWVSVAILCLVWFDVFLIVGFFMQLTLQLKVLNRERLWIFLGMFGLYFIYRLVDEFTAFFIIYAFFIFLMGWNVYKQASKYSVGIFASLLFCLALISSIKYQKFNDIKERNSRTNIAQKLQSSDEPKVISAIGALEKGINEDAFIQRYFRQKGADTHHLLENYIAKTYLDGYLSHFEYKIFNYNRTDSAIVNDNNTTSLTYFKQLVRSGSVKTLASNYFYKIGDAFGFHNYFGIIPIVADDELMGTLVIELKSQQLDYNSQFPDLLIDGKVKSDRDYSNYSFAFYNGGQLEKQSGRYTYKLINTDFEGEQGKPIFISDNVKGYSHLIYQVTPSKIIVISSEKVSFVSRMAALSFFFLVFILFSITLYCLVWLIKNIDDSWSGWFNINRSLMINANKILYKTRIQFSIVLSVVATLVIVGWTTFFYISEEYRNQQDDSIREKIRKIQLSYEKQIAGFGIPGKTDRSIVQFNQFADINTAYLNLFDVNGNLLYTSLPKLYEYGIVGDKMGSKAYIYLHYLQRSEYFNPMEKIGEFTYAAAYAPIRNVENQIVAYIGMPYFANEEEYENKIGLFINTLINIYALVFVGIGILAVFLANQITSPLTFIQESIKKTKLGQRNKPIMWPRHDEIGSLIKEYNKMIAALEESAVKLARSERESAWREMAKQVAHEIKNPLTPLKLGVQLLEKSWREKDENFDKKFERFNKSFIEQIDSLSTIASEFSNFAKMPDTKLQRIRVLPVIEQAMEVFTNTNNAEISITNETREDVHILGDKDQLLRTFNNLLKNAIEAAQPDLTCMINIRIMQDDNKLWIEVADNGKGIDSELQKKIFVPNFTTKSSGTGLGLAFVKQAVENAGGSIDFKSVTSQGTKFYLSFPLS